LCCFSDFAIDPSFALPYRRASVLHLVSESLLNIDH
jgi:hypothetical protein